MWSDQCVFVCPLSFTVTPEAIGFLSAVGVFVVFLAVLFLFINKKLCFSRVGGLPCLEQHGRGKRSRSRPGVRQGLGEWTGMVPDWGLGVMSLGLGNTGGRGVGSVCSLGPEVGFLVLGDQLEGWALGWRLEVRDCQ